MPSCSNFTEEVLNSHLKVSNQHEERKTKDDHVSLGFHGVVTGTVLGSPSQKCASDYAKDPMKENRDFGFCFRFKERSY